MEASLETKRSLLNSWVILADVERLQRQLGRSQELAQGVLADPAVRGDRRLEADAHWAHAYALAMQAKTGEAEAERVSALNTKIRISRQLPRRSCPAFALER